MAFALSYPSSGEKDLRDRGDRGERRGLRGLLRGANEPVDTVVLDPSLSSSQPLSVKLDRDVSLIQSDWGLSARRLSEDIAKAT